MGVISLLIREESSEDEDGAHPQGMLLHLCILCSSLSLELELSHKNLSGHRAGTCTALMAEWDVVPGAGRGVLCQWLELLLLLSQCWGAQQCQGCRGLQISSQKRWSGTGTARPVQWWNHHP